MGKYRLRSSPLSSAVGQKEWAALCGEFLVREHFRCCLTYFYPYQEFIEVQLQIPDGADIVAKDVNALQGIKNIFRLSYLFFTLVTFNFLCSVYKLSASLPVDVPRTASLDGICKSHR